MAKSISVILVAGGSGKRMGSDLPKQFLPLNGKPILLHTLENFYSWNKQCELIVVLPKQEMQLWTEILEKHECRIKHKTVPGGKERFNSVANGLEIATSELVFIHDGVRPLVSHQTLNACLNNLETNVAVVPVLPMVDSVRFVKAGHNKALNRSELFRVHTPQCFHTVKLKQAFNVEYNNKFTDDASVAEDYGIAISLVESNEENIKITRPIDTVMAEYFLKQ